MPVGPLPRDRGEQPAGAGPPGVDHHLAGHHGGRIPVQLAAGDLGDLGQGQRDHRSTAHGSRGGWPLAARSSADAVTARSSNGSTAPATYCPVSWPLPATTITSPAAARRDGLGDRGGPVGLDDDPGPVVLRHAQHPVQHRREDGQGVLGSRIVTGENGHIGQRRGGGAHHRALGPVPVAAAAEHDDQAAPGDRAQRAQHGLDRARLVRVVDEGGDVQPGGGHPLQPSRDARAGRDPGHRVLQPDAGLDQRDHGAERVGHVEHPGQPHRHVRLDPARADDAERAAVRAGPDVDRPPVRLVPSRPPRTW